MNVKLTKGLAAAAVSAAMMLGAAVPALAEDSASTTVPVVYTQEGEGTRPSETLTYTSENKSVEGSSVYSGTNFPMLTIAGTTVSSETTSGNVTITLPEYATVGIYKYELTPNYTVSNDAGVTYDTQHLFVTVTVQQGKDGLERTVAVHRGKADGGKTSDIALKYSTGKLTVTKEITGNLGDKKKAFNFKVELTGPQGQSINGTYHYTVPGSKDAKTINFVDGAATVEGSLADSQSIVITDLPAGVTYDVSELNGDNKVAEDGTGSAVDGYTLKSVKKSDSTETIAAKDSDTETYTNDKTDNNVDTGVLLNNAPYIAILGGAAVVAIYFVNKRRHSDMD
ncbi:hypothetical protein [Parafannyhessea umbonata]|uniref:DUF7601 domain-containing protein n=1 Tax=Parafannyhessea umbonata TaxID=604330 RepID=UPI002A800FD4|nr:hypothetical protein [Parafannyhessea umbonata]MDY4014478.1 hypothetical protein [Parafannyhessea umbonata]